LIGNQFPGFRGAANRCVIAATAAVFLHKFAPFLHFLRRPLLFGAQPKITMVTIWSGTSRTGANQCHDG
jgi:hypothetical protein